MVPEGTVRVLGRPAFHDLGLTTGGELAYLGAAWRAGTLRDAPLKGDLSAEKLIYGVAGADPVRRDRLVKLLDIDLGWRMLTASDGQRRRVQIAMGLLLPYKASSAVCGGWGGLDWGGERRGGEGGEEGGGGC